MKAGKAHRVPLCDRALELLREAAAQRVGDTALIFPGRDGKFSKAAFPPASETGSPGHYGARFPISSFRDWCGERTNFPREIAEAALAHKTGNAVEEAYRRGDALEKRRKLMEAWAAFCSRPAPAGATVVPLPPRQCVSPKQPSMR